MYKTIRVLGKKYYYEGTYEKYEKAKKTGKYYKKKNKSMYFITKTQNGMYKLWLTRTIKMY